MLCSIVDVIVAVFQRYIIHSASLANLCVNSHATDCINMYSTYSTMDNSNVRLCSIRLNKISTQFIHTTTLYTHFPSFSCCPLYFAPTIPTKNTDITTEIISSRCIGSERASSLAASAAAAFLLATFSLCHFNASP